MGSRRGLIVGIEKYAEGFTSLPFVRNDIALMKDVLARCGYQTKTASDSDIRDATALGTLFREFCEDCEEGDVYVIYFSGHGISVDGKDFVLPAGTRRQEAIESERKRVSTNLSHFISGGLVIMLVDACRDALIKKGADEVLHYESIDSAQFVCFFGCEKGEVCQVVKTDEHRPDQSLFTKALASAIDAGKSLSFEEIISSTKAKANEWVRQAGLKSQVPSLAPIQEKAIPILSQCLFDPPLERVIWKKFDPSKFHCLLIKSESEKAVDSVRSLEKMLDRAMEGRLGRMVWQAFIEFVEERVQLDGSIRDIPKQFDSSRIAISSCGIDDAFMDDVFDDVLRGLVEADIVVFDVTCFEPGVMLLMGIRSACRRGVSIATHGQGWHELDELDIPFNLRDLSLNSHTTYVGGAGKDPVAEALVARIIFGFKQMRKQPRYQDLPSYNALRELGPQYEAASTISVKEKILVLCSYGKTYREHWETVSNLLAGCLEEQQKNEQDGENRVKFEVVRIVDIGSPQLVSQLLYEYIRRVQGCVVDWTIYSPSTFYELGVRLAVSDQGAIQLVDEHYLPGGNDAGEWSGIRVQIRRMLNLFKPYQYSLDGDGKNVIKEAADELISRSSGLDESVDVEPPYNRVWRLVSTWLPGVAEAHAAVFDYLKDTADSLHNPMQGQKAAPQILFNYVSGPIKQQLTKQESERTALEMRIAALLYLHYRTKAGDPDTDPSLHEIYQSLGREASSRLWDQGDVDFASFIDDLLSEDQNK